MSTAASDRIAIEFISVFAMPLPEYVALAAELGVHRIGIAASPFTANPHGYPEWDLRTDSALVRDTRPAIAATRALLGVSG